MENRFMILRNAPFTLLVFVAAASNTFADGELATLKTHGDQVWV